MEHLKAMEVSFRQQEGKLVPVEGIRSIEDHPDWAPILHRFQIFRHDEPMSQNRQIALRNAWTQKILVEMERGRKSRRVELHGMFLLEQDYAMFLDGKGDEIDYRERQGGHAIVHVFEKEPVPLFNLGWDILPICNDYGQYDPAQNQGSVLNVIYRSLEEVRENRRSRKKKKLEILSKLKDKSKSKKKTSSKIHIRPPHTRVTLTYIIETQLLTIKFDMDWKKLNGKTRFL